MSSFIDFLHYNSESYMDVKGIPEDLQVELDNLKKQQEWEEEQKKKEEAQTGKKEL